MNKTAQTAILQKAVDLLGHGFNLFECKTGWYIAPNKKNKFRIYITIGSKNVHSSNLKNVFHIYCPTYDHYDPDVYACYYNDHYPNDPDYEGKNIVEAGTIAVTWLTAFIVEDRLHTFAAGLTMTTLEDE